MIYEKLDKLDNKRKVNEAFENYINEDNLIKEDDVSLTYLYEQSNSKDDNINLLLELFYEELKRLLKKYMNQNSI